VASDGQTFIPDHRPAGLGCGRPTEISSLATYVPPRLLTNQDLEKLVETTSEWILQRTGIHTRHIVDPGVATSDLGKEAALEAIALAGLTPADIDLVIVGTTTPDMFFPSTAALIQHKIGASHAWGSTSAAPARASSSRWRRPVSSCPLAATTTRSSLAPT